MHFWVFHSKHSSVTNRDWTTCPRAVEAGLKATHWTVWPASLGYAVTQICLLKGQKIKQPTGSPDSSDQRCFLLSTPNGKKPPWPGGKVASATPSGKVFYPPCLLTRVRLDFFFLLKLRGHLCDSTHPHLACVSGLLAGCPPITSAPCKLKAGRAEEAAMMLTDMLSKPRGMLALD